MRHRWIYIAGEAHEATDDYSGPVAPLVMPDIKPYTSMIDGREITSRSRHREHLRANNCIEIGNEKLTPKPKRAPPGLKDTIIRIANEKLRG